MVRQSQIGEGPHKDMWGPFPLHCLCMSCMSFKNQERSYLWAQKRLELLSLHGFCDTVQA